MKPRKATLLCFTMVLFLAPFATADSLTGKVVKVADGDSITVLDNTNTQHRIHLILAAVTIGFRFRNLSL